MNKERLGKYLHAASKALLLAFVLSIAVVGVIYNLNTNKMNYEVLSPGESIEWHVSQTNFTAITYNDYVIKQKQFNRWTWITLICLVGWMASNDKFRSNMIEAWREWNERINGKD